VVCVPSALVTLWMGLELSCTWGQFAFKCGLRDREATVWGKTGYKEKSKRVHDPTISSEKSPVPSPCPQKSVRHCLERRLAFK
jgi:hypothetical protein